MFQQLNYLLIAVTSSPAWKAKEEATATTMRCVTSSAIVEGKTFDKADSGRKHSVFHLQTLSILIERFKSRSLNKSLEPCRYGNFKPWACLWFFNNACESVKERRQEKIEWRAPIYNNKCHMRIQKLKSAYMATNEDCWENLKSWKRICALLVVLQSLWEGKEDY